MQPRYHKRIQIKIPVIFTTGARVGKGHTHDLTVPGCLIESSVSVKQGDYLELKLFLPGLTSLVTVALAAVRWTNGSQFGVEFIRMKEQEQRQLHHVMARHRSNQVFTQEGTRHQFGEPDGQNWYLDTYSLAKETKGVV